MSISFHKVEVKYNENYILEDTSYTFKEGFYLIEGENGSGKTTLLNSIYKKTKINKGNITINSIDIKKIPQRKIRNICSYSRQEVYLFNNLTIDENLLLLLSSKKEIQKCKKVIEKNLTSNFKEKIKELSGGQKKFLNLIIALNRKAEIYLIDEPFNSLSSKRIEVIMELIRNLKGIIIIIDHTERIYQEKITTNLCIKLRRLEDYEPY